MYHGSDAYLVEHNLSVLGVTHCHEGFLFLLIDFIVTWGQI